MAWQPNQGGVQQIVALLTEFQSPGADQHKVSPPPRSTTCARTFKINTMNQP